MLYRAGSSELTCATFIIGVQFAYNKRDALKH